MCPRTGTFLLGVIACQVCLTFLAWNTAVIMREEWMRLMPHISNSDVLLVKLPRFLGPVWAVVPRTCDDLKWWDTFVRSDEDLDEKLEAGTSFGDVTVTGPAYIGKCDLHMLMSAKDTVQDGAMHNLTKKILVDLTGLPEQQVHSTMYEFRRRLATLEVQASPPAPYGAYGAAPLPPQPYAAAPPGFTAPQAYAPYAPYGFPYGAAAPQPLVAEDSEAPEAPGHMTFSYGVELGDRINRIDERKSVRTALEGLKASIQKGLQDSGWNASGNNVSVTSCTRPAWLAAPVPILVAVPTLAPTMLVANDTELPDDLVVGPTKSTSTTFLPKGEPSEENHTDKTHDDEVPAEEYHSEAPTEAPATPTNAPTTNSPTNAPTEGLTAAPATPTTTTVPTNAPSASPTKAPTVAPTVAPAAPTSVPPSTSAWHPDPFAATTSAPEMQDAPAPAPIPQTTEAKEPVGPDYATVVAEVAAQKDPEKAAQDIVQEVKMEGGSKDEEAKEIDDIIITADMDPEAATKAAAHAMKEEGGSMLDIENIVLNSVPETETSDTKYAEFAKAAAEAVQEVGGTGEQATKTAVDAIIDIADADGPDAGEAAAVVADIAKEMGRTPSEAALAAADTARGVALAAGYTQDEADTLAKQMEEDVAGRRLDGQPSVWDKPDADTDVAVAAQPGAAPGPDVAGPHAAAPYPMPVVGPYAAPGGAYSAQPTADTVSPGGTVPAFGYGAPAYGAPAYVHAYGAPVYGSAPMGYGTPMMGQSAMDFTDGPTSAPTEEVEVDIYNESAATEGDFQKINPLNPADWSKLNWNRIFNAINPFHKGPAHTQSIAIERCGSTILFEQTRVNSRYLSMVTFGKIFHRGTPDIEDLITKREMGFRPILFGLIFSGLLKYLTKVLDIVAGTLSPAHRYVQLWNKSRTRCDKILESVLVHSMAIVFSLGLQTCLTTMFFIFWRRDHFVMSYMPDVGLWMFFVSLALLTAANVLDRCNGFLVHRSNTELYMFWLFWIGWMMLISVPMLGFSCFSLWYLVEVNRSGWMDQMDFVSPEFVAAAKKSSILTCLFFVCGILDFICIVRMDMDKNASSATMVVEDDPMASRKLRMGF